MNGKKVLRIMKKYYLMAEYIRKAKIKHKNERIDDNVKPNLLNRNFSTDALNKAWDTDVTYLIFKGSRAYLSTIIDLYDRHVVSYVISKRNDLKLVMDTLNKAISKEKNVPKLPSGILYLRNLNGEKNADGKIISYFPEARGIKTERYTLAISIDKQHNIKHIFFYDDIKDPYQMNNLSITENQKIFEDLCRQMGQLLKQVNDPWYKDRILSSKIPY